ncbi:MAG: SDR family NAD(P)-dependent oxidoreductase [Planctomycetota bacterium]|nr:SDR family NAD(P)-dependent oxidoreductase [Planctomycetota bacterium]
MAITGASSGIGEALARAYGHASNRLTIVARRTERLQQLATELDAPTHSITADLSDLTTCCDWIDEAESTHGPIDLFLNNAGIQIVDPVLAVDPDRRDQLFRLDLLAPLRMIHRIAPGMVERESGVVVNISSVAGLVATPGMCHYNAAKSGFASFSEGLGWELRSTGVHVVTVYPGPIRTAMEEKARKRLGGGFADLAPTGSTEKLARLIVRAVSRKRRRVIYPRFYVVTRIFRGTAQWITDRLTPPLKDRRD